MNRLLMIGLVLSIVSLPVLADGNVIHSWETEQGNCGHQACKGEPVIPDVPDVPTVDTPEVPTIDNHIVESYIDNGQYYIKDKLGNIFTSGEVNTDTIYDDSGLIQSINNVNNRVNTNRDMIEEVSQNVRTNQDSINQLGTIVNNHDTAIKQNAKNIDTLNKNQIYINDKVDSNTNKINEVNRQVNTNTSSIDNIQKRLDNTNTRINKLDDKIESGLATVTALTALHPNPRAQGRTQVAVGTGMYRDNVAGAIGIFHFINDNTMLSAGASYGGHHEFAGNVGITFSFGGKK